MHGNPRKRNDELMIGSAGCDLPLGEVLNVKLVGPSTDKAEKNIVFFSTQGAKAAKNINIDAGNQNLKIEIPLEFSYKPFQEVGTKVTIANAKPLAVTFKVHEDLKKEVKGNTITIGGVPYKFNLTPEEVQQIAKKSGLEVNDSDSGNEEVNEIIDLASEPNWKHSHVRLINTDSPEFDPQKIKNTEIDGDPEKRDDVVTIGSAGYLLSEGKELEVKLVSSEANGAETNTVVFSSRDKAAKNINIDAGDQDLIIEIPKDSYEAFQKKKTNVTIIGAKTQEGESPAVTFKVDEDLKKGVTIKEDTITIGGVPYKFNLTTEEVQQIAKKSGFEVDTETSASSGEPGEIIVDSSSRDMIGEEGSSKYQQLSKLYGILDILDGLRNAKVNPTKFADAATRNISDPFTTAQTGGDTTETNPEGKGTNYAFSNFLDYYAHNTSSRDDLGNIGDLRATMAYYSFDHDNNNGGGDPQNIVSQQDQTPTITASADITIA
jgi:hypothetical protein